MGVINSNNMLTFKPTDQLFARVRKRLNSFDAMGILDEGDFYYYIKAVIEMLGVAIYEEGQILVGVKHHRTPLPDNFAYLYAAYSTSPVNLSTESKQTCFPQEGFSMYLEETWQPFKQCKGTNCLAAKFDFVEGQALRVREYVHGKPNVLNFNRPILLRLSPNAKRHLHHDSIHNQPGLDIDTDHWITRSLDEITIHEGFIHTNFEEGSIFMKYFGFPYDAETGLPMIPNNTFIEKAIEDYIIYRIIEDMWFNGLVPDMDNRYKIAKVNHEESLKAALYYVKTPSFNEAVNWIRIQRKNLRIYQQTNFER